MTLDTIILSRVQWAWVIAWHILLPAFTVGLASYIAVLEGLYFFTGREIWFRISGFWIKIFAVSFGMGVVSGIIMPFQFGTNWSRFSDVAVSQAAGSVSRNFDAVHQFVPKAPYSPGPLGGFGVKQLQLLIERPCRK